MHSINSPKIKLFISKLLLEIIVSIKYIMTIIIDKILNLILLFLFIKGLFTVSDGAYKLIIIKANKYNVYNK